MINAKQEITSRYPSGLSSSEVTTVIEIDSEFPDRKVKIGTTLDSEIKDQLVTFLKENKHTFAWSAKDMPGIDKSIITQIEK